VAGNPTDRAGVSWPYNLFRKPLVIWDPVTSFRQAKFVIAAKAEMEAEAKQQKKSPRVEAGAKVLAVYFER